MDWSCITDIQHAILALQDIRCGSVKYLRRSPVPKITYCSKLDAIQNELYFIVQSLKPLVDFRHWMSNFEKPREQYQFKHIAIVARLGVSALSDKIDQLGKDVDRDLSEVPTETKHLSEGTGLWNRYPLRLLTNVPPKDENTINLDQFKLSRFYDTMRDMDSELAAISTHLGFTNRGTTLGSRQILWGTATNPPTKPGLDRALHGERGGTRDFPARDRPTSRSRVGSSYSRAERHAHDITLDSNVNATKHSRTVGEDSLAVPSHSCPNKRRPFHCAKDSLELNIKFPRRSRSEDQYLKLADRTPHPYQQFPLSDDLETDPECSRDLSDLMRFDKLNYHRPRQNATVGLPPVNESPKGNNPPVYAHKRQRYNEVVPQLNNTQSRAENLLQDQDGRRPITSSMQIRCHKARTFRPAKTHAPATANYLSGKPASREKPAASYAMFGSEYDYAPSSDSEFATSRSPPLSSSSPQPARSPRAPTRPRIMKGISHLVTLDKRHESGVHLAPSLEGRLYRYHNGMSKAKKTSDAYEVEARDHEQIARHLTIDKKDIDPSLASSSAGRRGPRRISSILQRPRLRDSPHRRKRTLSQQYPGHQGLKNSKQRRLARAPTARGDSSPAGKIAQFLDGTKSARGSSKDKKTSLSTTTLKALKTKDKQETVTMPREERIRKKIAKIVDWTQEVTT